MSKKTAFIGIIVVLIVIIFGLQLIQEVRQRQALKNVEITLDGVGLKSIGFTSATLDVRLRMFNPNTITATLDRADYDLYGNNVQLGYGVIRQRIDIPPGGIRVVSTDFTLSYSGAGQLIWSALREGKVSWRIRGTAYFDTPLGAIPVPFDAVL
jgi:LEA14-like dessication related protein